MRFFSDIKINNSYIQLFVPKCSNQTLKSSPNLPFLLGRERFSQPLSTKACPFAVRAASRPLQERTKLCHNWIIHIGNGNVPSGIHNARLKIFHSFLGSHQYSCGPWFHWPDLKTFTWCTSRDMGHAPKKFQWETLIQWWVDCKQILRKRMENGPWPIGRKDSKRVAAVLQSGRFSFKSHNGPSCSPRTYH